MEYRSEQEKYLSRFYEPKITAYEFLKCFFAYLKKENVNEVDRDLITFLHEQKKKEENKEVLEEINFRSNGVNYYSDDVEDALFNLQNGGLLGKMNPSFGVLIIKYDDESEINKTLESISPEYKNTIEEIAKEYRIITAIS